MIPVTIPLTVAAQPSRVTTPSFRRRGAALDDRRRLVDD